MTKEPVTAQWYYLGPDEQSYGPFSGSEMYQWVVSGYFNDSVPVRTENDVKFRPIGEWMRFTRGTLPFNQQILSFDHMISTLRPQVMLPPGLPAPNLNLVPHQRFFLPPSQNGMTNGMPPISMGPNAIMPLPGQFIPQHIDGQQNSQTPDSENEYGGPRSAQQFHHERAPPPLRVISRGTDPIEPKTVDIGVNTSPIVFSAKDLERALSDLFKQAVQIV